MVNLPGYGPDFNADEAIWGRARQEVTANLCLGTKAVVREKAGGFFASLARRRERVKRRCRTELQDHAQEITSNAQVHPLRIDQSVGRLVHDGWRQGSAVIDNCR